jgi:hypothetical protein
MPMFELLNWQVLLSVVKMSRHLAFLKRFFVARLISAFQDAKLADVTADTAPKWHMTVVNTKYRYEIERDKKKM